MRRWGLLNNRYLIAPAVVAGMIVFVALMWAVTGAVRLWCLLFGHDALYNKRGLSWCRRCNQEKPYDVDKLWSGLPRKRRVYVVWDDDDYGGSRRPARLGGTWYGTKYEE